jgi:integrating conjugative element protein (TIGR03759 family)
MLVLLVCFNAYGDTQGKQGTEIKESELTDVEFAHAKQWRLSTDEYVRFKSILGSARDYITPSLEKNPVLALGLTARTEQERSYYADLWVSLQYDITVQDIKWQLAVNDAWDKAHPNAVRFAYTPNTSHKLSSNQNLMSGVREQLYIRYNGCDKCITRFKESLLKVRRQQISGIDVYFVGSVDNNQIAKWAADRVGDSGLSIRDVNIDKIVTLNISDSTPDSVPFVKFE